MSDRNELDFPPTGSYPGYEQGLKMLDAWRNFLYRQANLANDIWSKLKGGTFEAKDGYRAIVETVESSATEVERMLRALGGATNPPWVSLPPEAKGAVAVRLRQPISGTDVLRVSRLSMVGGAQSQTLTAKAEPTGSYSIKVRLSGKAERAGDYLGFVSIDRYADPLAILSVSVRPTARKITTSPRKIR